jgi:hypothetical protein
MAHRVFAPLERFDSWCDIQLGARFNVRGAMVHSAIRIPSHSAFRISERFRIPHSSFRI